MDRKLVALVLVALVGGVFLATTALRSRLPALADHCKEMCKDVMSGAGKPAATECN